MEEPRRDRSPNELFDRIARLENATAAQATTIAELTQRLDNFTKEQKGLHEIEHEIREVAFDQIKMHHRVLLVAFERINALCVKVFPELVQDLLQLRSILGTEEEELWNQLDHNAPPRPSTDPKS
jgi:uncharacterized coiled-coil protein SlyX